MGIGYKSLLHVRAELSNTLFSADYFRSILQGLSTGSMVLVTITWARQVNVRNETFPNLYLATTHGPWETLSFHRTLSH